MAPVIDDWHPDALEGFHALSSAMQEMSAILRQTVKSWIGKHPKEIIKEPDEIPESITFWREFFIQGFKCRPSKRSLQNFVDQLTRFKTKTNDPALAAPSPAAPAAPTAAVILQILKHVRSF